MGGGPPARPDGVGATIVIGGSSAREVQRGQSLALAVKVDTGPADLTPGLEVVFYDGDPGRRGTVIGRSTCRT